VHGGPRRCHILYEHQVPCVREGDCPPEGSKLRRLSWPREPHDKHACGRFPDGRSPPRNSSERARPSAADEGAPAGPTDARNEEDSGRPEQDRPGERRGGHQELRADKEVPCRLDSRGCASDTRLCPAEDKHRRADRGDRGGHPDTQEGTRAPTRSCMSSGAST